MPFYIRQSVKVGPLRFNLSKSGIGMSTGIPGFRVGTGPRGNYVHMGANGLYYRKTLSNSNAKRKPGAGGTQARHAAPSSPVNLPQDLDPGHGPMQEIDSTDVGQMVDASSEALLTEIKQKQSKGRPLTILFAVLTVAAVWVLWAGAANIVGTLLALGLGLVLVAWGAMKDEMGRSVVIFYEFDPEQQSRYESLMSALSDLGSVGRIWHQKAKADVTDWKRNSGAGRVVDRDQIKLGKQPPAWLKCNVDIYSLPVGRQTLYFMPERVLVLDGHKAGAVSYSDLNIEFGNSRFIESQGAPHDTEIVGQTWKYVNKKGGPDRRFKDNVEYPICLYQDIYFKSKTGLNELIQVSRPRGIGEGLSKASQQLGAVLKV